MTYKQLQTNFERELLFYLIFNMKNGKIDLGRARKVAKTFLEVLKSEITINGFMNSLSKKAEFYPEIRETFLKTASEYEKEKVTEELDRVRQILKEDLN